MSLKRVVLATLGLLVFAAAGFADRIDFSFEDGEWSWGGNGTILTATSTDITVKKTGGGNPKFKLTNIMFTTGTATTPGSDPVADPPAEGSATFATGGSIVVRGTLGSDVICTGVFGSFTNVCFSGSFNSGASGKISPDADSMTLSAFRITGTLDPALLLKLGIDPTATAATDGVLNASLLGDSITFTQGGQGDLEVGSGNLIVTPIPEPGSLALLGTGLLGVVGLLRRKGIC